MAMARSEHRRLAMEIYEFGALILCVVLSCVGLVILADVIREYLDE